MAQDLDISNIESKPAVVLVSNQSEFDQLMQHLEKEGLAWVGQERPTQFQPNDPFPYLIRINGKDIECWVGSSIAGIPFSEYSAKHIFPNLIEYTKEEVEAMRSPVYDPVKLDIENNKAKPEKIEEASFYYFNKSQKKFKCIKANSHLQGTYSTFIDSRGHKHIFPNEDIYLHKWKSPKRDRIRIERKKYDELVADLRETSRYADGLFQKLEQAVAERDRLKAENSELMQAYKMQNQRHKGDAERFDEIINTKAAEHAHLDTLARKLRDQRDMARFIAALLLIVSVGFAIAVWIGKLIPVV